jgi:hypothetical protein
MPSVSIREKLLRRGTKAIAVPQSRLFFEPHSRSRSRRLALFSDNPSEIAPDR